MRRAGAGACVLAVALVSCTPPAPDDRDQPSSTLAPAAAQGVTVTFQGAPTLTVEVASTPDSRRVGLMNRPALPAGTGMLFVFPGPATGGFWMKNTLVPLSIAYVDGDRVVSIAEMQPCPPATPACPTYDAAASYTAAVEAPGGFFTQHRVGPGTTVTVNGTTPAPR